MWIFLMLCLGVGSTTAPVTQVIQRVFDLHVAGDERSQSQEQTECQVDRHAIQL